MVAADGEQSITIPRRGDTSTPVLFLQTYISFFPALRLIYISLSYLMGREQDHCSMARTFRCVHINAVTHLLKMSWVGVPYGIP